MDFKYLELINKVKPKKDYFQQNLGDKLLFLERVDTIKYDIIDEERKKQADIVSSKLQVARLEKKNT